MRTLWLLAAQFWTLTFRDRSIWVLYALVSGLLVYALALGWLNFGQQRNMQQHYRQEARHDWLSNPDKHPHRMAHYGHYAIRPTPPLSLLDIGMEHFMGNTIYLEAHKQNAVNFSEASLSTGMLRFGELSVALVLQGLLPLVTFFLGFSSIATDREQGTLKLLLSQGVSWGQLLAGKTLGLLAVVLTFYVPIMSLAGLTLAALPGYSLTLDDWSRFGLLGIAYLLYIGLFCGLAVLVSARSRTAKTALVSSIGLWLLLTIVLPRVTQGVGSYLHPTPSKAAFETAILADILKQGDSHNPTDPHYKTLKDSVLAVHGVASVEQLPFNFSGLVMTEGERISATIYTRHFDTLQTVYARQNQLARLVTFVNPYMALRNLSMALCTTDYATYVDFGRQAEAYRYALAQQMNQLQMKYISARTTGPGSNKLSRAYWQQVPDFTYRAAGVGYAVTREWPSLLALIGWLFLLCLLAQRFTQTLTAS